MSTSATTTTAARSSTGSVRSPRRRLRRQRLLAHTLVSGAIGPYGHANMTTRRFDPNAAAQPGSGVFSLPHTTEEAGVILVPVPWEVTTSYRPGTAAGPA